MMLLIIRLISLLLLLPRLLVKTLLNLPMLLLEFLTPILIRRFVRRGRRMMGAALTMASIVKRQVMWRTVLK
ncbi:hypothetical protein ANAPC1_01377 [Anaplasma phagocytophilum]|uniref:Uncharacterized protein n=1 Tax=Anaplasma phagocytophilum TaxID=948 RepID=A0AA45ZI57_ANAPH|nr:hypothetical protein [Anaplasma phagocytophilum]SBO14999.1 hypothetical protein ANAPC1_01377 [Anaplasma phagocytophilum]SBO33196.1 hypothetical protein ANAPC2_01282 [Anaplasma phagocytophilum]SBO33635.1 hypothetical protein ANAPC3_01301 [Anaplasma phagocytophilum]SBO33766.1 hypothetical protein ANAPC4_01285 [Anaplasma phagocytophilum]